ncbi:MAG: sodium:calcium antiporter [Oligoflexus sp.]
MDLTQSPLSVNLLVFILASLGIIFSGTKLTLIADYLADRLGWGEALTGAILLGATTSLADLTVTMTAALQGHPNLAISNAIGGIAAQTTFLAVADMFYRRANLEHAAASLGNILFGVVVIALLAGVMMTSYSPKWTVFGVHPMTPILFSAYFFSLHLQKTSHQKPMWKPRETTETRQDVPNDQVKKKDLKKISFKFAILAALLALSGWLIAESSLAIAAKTGLKETVMGGVFTAISTSTPELVTTIIAVRHGALTLAVGNVLGGNAFDVMLAVLADLIYLDGSVYHAMSQEELFLLSLAIIMTSVLVIGMLQREKYGFGNIGFESSLVIVLYLSGVGIMLAGFG